MDEEDIKPDVSGGSQHQSSASPRPSYQQPDAQTDQHADEQQQQQDDDEEEQEDDQDHSGSSETGQEHPDGNDGEEGEESDAGSDSSEDRPLASDVVVRKRAKAVADTLGGLFKARNMLPLEVFGVATIKEIYTLIKKGVIDLSPSYQRESVWSPTVSSALMRSIFLNMHVPPLLFNIMTPSKDHPLYAFCKKKDQAEPAGDDEDAEDDPHANDKEVRRIWTCMDGKQRMTAICRFIDGDIKVQTDKGKFHYLQLEQEAREAFDDRLLQYGYYENLSTEQERAMFFAVQQGKILTKGEVLASINSPYANWIHELKAEFVSAKNNLRSFGTRLFADSRGTDISTAFQIAYGLLQMQRGNFDSLSHVSAPKRTNIMQDEDPPTADEKAEVHRIFKRFQRLTCVAPLRGQDWQDITTEQAKREKGIIVPHRVWRIKPSQLNLPDTGVARSKSEVIALAPVEMYLLPAVVYKFEDLSDGLLLELIESLRLHLHSMYRKEMKDNKKVYDEVKDWCHDLDVDEDLFGKYNNDGTRTDALPPSRSGNKKEKEKAKEKDAAPPKKSTTSGSSSKAASATPSTFSSSVAEKKKFVPAPIATASKPAAPVKQSRPAPKPVPRSTPAPSSSTFLPSNQGASTSSAVTAPAPSGMSEKQKRFALSSNGGSSNPLSSLPSSKKRSADPVEYDERGRLVRRREESVQAQAPPDMMEMMAYGEVGGRNEREDDHARKAREVQEMLRLQQQSTGGHSVGAWRAGGDNGGRGTLNGAGPSSSRGGRDESRGPRDDGYSYGNGNGGGYNNDWRSSSNGGATAGSEYGNSSHSTQPSRLSQGDRDRRASGGDPPRSRSPARHSNGGYGGRDDHHRDYRSQSHSHESGRSSALIHDRPSAPPSNVYANSTANAASAYGQRVSVAASTSNYGAPPTSGYRGGSAAAAYPTPMPAVTADPRRKPNPPTY